MLDSSYYELKNVLNYGIFLGHWKEFTNSSNSLGRRISHLTIAAFELPPLLGQVLALFELAIYQLRESFTTCCTKDLSEKDIVKDEDEGQVEQVQDQSLNLDTVDLPSLKTRIIIAAAYILPPLIIYGIAANYYPADLLREPINLYPEIVTNNLNAYRKGTQAFIQNGSNLFLKAAASV